MARKYKVVLIVIALVIAGFLILNRRRPASGEPIKIGVIVPLTGDIAVLGGRIRNGMELAKEEMLEQGIVDSIELIFEDVCLPKDAVSATQKLIQFNQVSIIGGSFCLIGFVPIIPIVQENKVIAFNTAANPDDVLNKKYVFSTNVSIKNDSEQLAKFAYENLKAKTAAIIYLNTPFGQSYNQHLTKFLENLGGQVLFSETKLIDANDFRTELTKIKSLNVDVIFAIHHENSLGNLLKQAKELGIKSRILGDYESDDPTVLEAAGEGAEGFIISSSEPVEKTDKIKSFEEKYSQKFGEQPDVLAANAYDALWLQVLTYNKCNGAPDCMSEELHKVKNYSGASGIISINPDGSASKPTVFKIVRNGEFVKYEE